MLYNRTREFYKYTIFKGSFENLTNSQFLYRFSREHISVVDSYYNSCGTIYEYLGTTKSMCWLTIGLRVPIKTSSQNTLSLVIPVKLKVLEKQS